MGVEHAPKDSLGGAARVEGVGRPVRVVVLGLGCTALRRGAVLEVVDLVGGKIIEGIAVGEGCGARPRCPSNTLVCSGA